MDKNREIFEGIYDMILKIDHSILIAMKKMDKNVDGKIIKNDTKEYKDFIEMIDYSKRELIVKYKILKNIINDIRQKMSKQTKKETAIETGYKNLLEHLDRLIKYISLGGF